MSWFRVKNQKPDFTCLQLQTATSTLPIPIVWGTTKVSPNVIFYGNFQSQGGGGGKGGIFSPGATATTYSCDIIMALCEGPIGGVNTIWKDQSTYTMSDLGLTLYSGSTPQSVWGYLATAYPNEALAYQGTAFVCAASYNLGGEADVGNHNFEVQGVNATSGANGVNANPAEVIYDFLTNPQYGAGFNSSRINVSTLFGPANGGDASLESYCNASGIAISPCLTSAEQASSILTRWLQILNCAPVWSEGMLSFIPYGDTAIAAGEVTTSAIITVPEPPTGASGYTPAPSVQVCGSSAFVSDGGVVYTFTGAALSCVGASAPSSAGQYGISPNGTYLFAASDEGQSLTITYTYTRTVAYVPNLTPIYSLTDLDFVDEKGNKDPVTVSRADPYSLPNIQRIEVLSRANQYAGTPVEARDQSQIELYGPRVGSTITAHEICDDVFVAPVVAQAILQRGLYVRTHFQFKLSWEYCLLDPMDIVEITDANLGLNAYPVRITTIEEDDKGFLTITAEELTVGVSTPVRYNNNGPRGFLPNRAAPADPVNAPLIFEPPPTLTNNVSEVWIGASGGENGVADPNWGGASVFLSLDNVSYSEIATITQKLRQGVLAAALAAASGWDATDTLEVNMAESAGALTGTSAASAKQGATLALIDNEFLAYQSATLTAVNAYSLTGLARGLYGTSGAAHAPGAAFARLDSAVVKYALPSAYIGQTLYFKFQSFNVFGGGVQSLADCAVYSYTPNGAGEIGPVALALGVGTSLNLGLCSQSVSESDNFGSAAAPVYQIDNLGTTAS